MSGVRFVKLPAALLYDSDVSDGTVRAYMVLAHNAIAVSSDTFEMSGDQLGTLLGRTRRQAARILTELVAHGLVDVVESRRGRARPNLITVLDPQETVFTGLHVARGETSVSHQGETEMSHPGETEMSHPSIEGREEREGQRSKRSASALRVPSPVDNGGAPRPPCPVPGHEHAMKRAYGECAACWSERTTGPPF